MEHTFTMRDVYAALKDDDVDEAMRALSYISDSDVTMKMSDLFLGRSNGCAFASTLMSLAVQIRMSPAPELTLAAALTLLTGLVEVPVPVEQ